MDRDRQGLLDYYAVGLSLDGHPMQTVREKLEAGGAVSSRELQVGEGWFVHRAHQFR